MEWLACKFPFLKKWRKVVVRCTIILTIFGVCLSTLHQSSLGALYLIAPGKLHPLWYSPFMPMFFFVSSMAAGCSMVIFEGMWAHKGVHHYMDETHLREADEVVFSFSKAGAFILFGYFMPVSYTHLDVYKRQVPPLPHDVPCGRLRHREAAACPQQSPRRQGKGRGSCRGPVTAPVLAVSREPGPFPEGCGAAH